MAKIKFILTSILFVIILSLILLFYSGYIYKFSGIFFKPDNRLHPIIDRELETGQKLKIYNVTINSDTCYISEIVNPNGIVAYGGLNCIRK